MMLGEKTRIGRHGFILIIILVLGLFLRIYCLTCESLWLDEGISVTWAHMEPEQIVEVSAKDVQFPLYILILHYWINLFGETEFALRFLSVIFGFLAIFMMYKVGTLIFDKKTGILSSFFVALSQFHIHFSQEARPYVLMALLTLFSMYFFIRILEKRTHWNSIGYIVSSILLMYTHVFGVFIIVSQNLYIAMVFLFSKKPLRPKLKQWVLFQVIIILLFAPWLGILTGQILEVQKPDSVASWIKTPSTFSIFFTFTEYSGWGFLPFLLLWIYISAKGLKNRFNITLRGISNYVKEHFQKIDLSSRTYLLLVWLFIPILLPYAISQFSAPIYLTKYTIGASPAFYLLVANWVRGIDFERAKSAAIVTFVILSFASLWLYYTEINKDQWREVASYLDTNAEPGDLLLFHAGYGIYGPADYYLNRTDLSMEAFPSSGYGINETDIDELASIQGEYDRIWLILFHSYDEQGLIKESLDESHTLKDYQLYDSMEYLDHIESILGYNLYNSIELYLFERQ